MTVSSHLERILKGFKALSPAVEEGSGALPWEATAPTKISFPWLDAAETNATFPQISAPLHAMPTFGPLRLCAFAL